MTTCFRARHFSIAEQASEDADLHDRVMRDGDDARAVVAYVLRNPVRAGLVKTARDYRWSGSLRFTLAELEEYGGQWRPDWKR